MDFKTSYRVILQIAQFLNNHVIGYERIISANVNPNSTTVKYIICDKKLESTADYIIDKIVRKIKKKILM
jgi:hypothetical protein